MCCTLKRLLAAAPTLALAAGAAVLATGALSGRWADAPAGSAAVLAPAADAVAPAPAGLSPATTTRDWQEVAGSKSKPTYQP